MVTELLELSRASCDTFTHCTNWDSVWVDAVLRRVSHCVALTCLCSFNLRYCRHVLLLLQGGRLEASFSSGTGLFATVQIARHRQISYYITLHLHHRYHRHPYLLVTASFALVLIIIDQFIRVTSQPSFENI